MKKNKLLQSAPFVILIVPIAGILINRSIGAHFYFLEVISGFSFVFTVCAAIFSFTIYTTFKKIYAEDEQSKFFAILIKTFVLRLLLFCLATAGSISIFSLLSGHLFTGQVFLSISLVAICMFISNMNFGNLLFSGNKTKKTKSSVAIDYHRANLPSSLMLFATLAITFGFIAYFISEYRIASVVALSVTIWEILYLLLLQKKVLQLITK